MLLRSLSLFARAALALAVPTLLAASCGGNVIVDDPQCEGALTRCGDECVNLNIDIFHCGSCDAGCFEGTCNNGACEAFNTCPPDLSNCSGSCVDLSSDSANCGGCGITCPDSPCFLGSCSTDGCFCGDICDVISLGSGVPQTAFASTFGAKDQWVPSCVSGSGEDVVFSFFPPSSGLYTFDTSGSSVPTVLDVMDPGCGSHACEGFGPGLSVYLAGGQHVLVAVDTQGQQGEVQLNINFTGEGECVTCGEFITNGDPGPALCPGSDALYDKLVTCVCVEKCAMVCDGLCSANDLSSECQQCVFDPAGGCGVEYNECANDF